MSSTSSYATEQSQSEEDDDDGEVFYVVSDMPEFPGGDMAFRKYIAENVKYPEEAKAKNIQGTVYVKFVINASGRVTNVEVNRGVNPLLDAEAIRVVKSSPLWKPGKQNGKPVKVGQSVPIKFGL